MMFCLVAVGSMKLIAEDGSTGAAPVAPTPTPTIDTPQVILQDTTAAVTSNQNKNRRRFLQIKGQKVYLKVSFPGKIELVDRKKAGTCFLLKKVVNTALDAGVTQWHITSNKMYLSYNNSNKQFEFIKTAQDCDIWIGITNAQGQIELTNPNAQDIILIAIG
jgi:hypothetical protein